MLPYSHRKYWIVQWKRVLSARLPLFLGGEEQEMHKGLHEPGARQAAQKQKVQVTHCFHLARACSIIIDGSEDACKSYVL